MISKSIHSIPGENKVILKASYGRSGITHEQVLHAVPVVDSMTNKVLGIPTTKEEVEKLGLINPPTIDSTYIIKDGVEFDLNNPEQKAIWEWVKHLPQIAHSEEELSKKKGIMFYVYKPLEETYRKLSKFELEFEMLEYIKNIPDSDLSSILRLLGHLTDALPTPSKRELLIDEYRLNPDKVRAIKNDKDINTRIFMYKALDKGLIRKDDKGVWYAFEAPVGYDSQMIAWLESPNNSEKVDIISQGLYEEPKLSAFSEAEVQTSSLTKRTKK